MNKPHGSAIGDWLRACASLHVQDPEAYAQVARLLGLDIALPQPEEKIPVPVQPVIEPIAPTVIQPVEETVIETAPAPIAPTPAITYLQPIRTERPSAQDLQKPMLTIQSEEELNQAIFLPGGGILTSSDLVVWDDEGMQSMSLGVGKGPAISLSFSEYGDLVLVGFEAEIATVLLRDQKMANTVLLSMGMVYGIQMREDGLHYMVATGVGGILQGHVFSTLLDPIVDLQESVIALAFDAYHQMIVSGTNIGNILQVNLQGGNLSGSSNSMIAHKAPVMAVACSPDSQTFASGAGNGEIKLWDPASLALTPRLSLLGHTAAINSLAFHPGQPYLASGSADTTIRLWHTTTGQCQLTLSPGSSPITSVAWNADGSRLLASSWDGQVHLWDFAVLQALMADKTQVAAPASPSGGSESPATAPLPRPRLQPLFQPEWQAGLIHGLASARQMGQALDLPRLVDQAARLQPFTELPHRHDFRGGSRVQLLIDRDDQMMAFLQDSKDLEKECRRLLGKEALDIQRFHGDPDEGAGPGPIWDWLPYQPPAPGTHIVLVSNLGAMPWHTGFESPRWRRFARCVADAGCHLTCLSPLRPTRYSPGLVRALRIVFWDRRTQLAHIHRLARP